MEVPEAVVVLFSEETVVTILGCGLLEGWTGSVHNEEDDTCSEDVHF